MQVYGLAESKDTREDLYERNVTWGLLTLLFIWGPGLIRVLLLARKKNWTEMTACQRLQQVLNYFLLWITQRVSIYYLLISKIDRDMRPPAKLSYRSAIHKKVVFGSGDAWTLPQIQGEVGGDQEPPGNTWRYPMGSKKILLILNHI